MPLVFNFLTWAQSFSLAAFSRVATQASRCLAGTLWLI